MLKKFMLVLCLMTTPFITIGCEEGPMEEAGEEMDEAVEEAGEEIE